MRAQPNSSSCSQWRNDLAVEAKDPHSTPPEVAAELPPVIPAQTERLGDASARAMLELGRTGSARGTEGWIPPTPVELQASFPHFEIREMIGRGGMGAIYKCWQKCLERFVAIKVLAPGFEDGGVAHFDERFAREAKALARLKHPGIVSVFDAGETADGLAYFIMEYVEGSDLHDLIAAEGRLPPDQAVAITCHLCDALAYAHAHGVVHRDMKPANVMIDEEGRVKVADFGLARMGGGAAGRLTVPNLVIGTPEYTAPEAFAPETELDQRADLYSVGVMLYQMLTGIVPRGRCEPPSGLIAGLDPCLDAIVDKAMQADRDRRYAAAGELRADLDPASIAAGRGGGAVFGPGPTRSERARWPIFSAAAVIGVLAAGGALWWSGEKAGTPASMEASSGAARATAEILRHSWRPVPAKDHALIDQGLVHLLNYDSWAAPRFRIANVAVRATIIWQPSPPGRNEFIKVGTRWTDSEHYFAAIHGSAVELGFYHAPTQLPLQHWAIDPPPQPGEAIRLQLASVGRHLAVWVRDRLVGVLDDPAITGSANLGVQAVDGHVQSLEYLDLDGLSEMEALKRLGLEGISAGPIQIADGMHWTDAFAETPLREVIAKAEHNASGYRLPESNHWYLPTRSVQAGALRVRASSFAGHFISLCLFLDDQTVYRLRFHGERRECVWSRSTRGAPETEVVIRDIGSCSDGHPHEVLLARAGGRLSVWLDGKRIHEEPADGAVAGRFALDVFQGANIFADRVEYVNMDARAQQELQKLLPAEGR